MKTTLSELLERNGTLFVFYILSPFIFWLFSNAVINVILIATTVLLFLVAQKQHLEITRRKKTIVLTLLVFALYLFTPFFGGEWNLGRLLQFIPLFFIIFYNKKILSNIYLNIYRVFYFLSLFALVVFLLNVIGLNLPYLIIYGDRTNPNDYYRLYGLVVELYRGGSPISGFGFSRISGAFKEPGHFGIYLGIILFAEKLNFKKKQNIVLLITGFLTFSIAFLFIFLIGAVYVGVKQSIISPKTILVGFLFFSVGFIFLVINPSIYENLQFFFFDRAFGDSESLIEVRSSNLFAQEFESFLNSSSTWFGYQGLDKDDILAYQSNFTAFIFRNGIIGISLCVLVFFNFFLRHQENRLFFLSLMVIALGILAHRYWMATEPAIYALFLIITFGKASIVSSGKSVSLE